MMHRIPSNSVVWCCCWFSTWMGYHHEIPGISKQGQKTILLEIPESHWQFSTRWMTQYQVVSICSCNSNMKAFIFLLLWIQKALLSSYALELLHVCYSNLYFLNINWRSTSWRYWDFPLAQRIVYEFSLIEYAGNKKLHVDHDTSPFHVWVLENQVNHLYTLSGFAVSSWLDRHLNLSSALVIGQY